MCTEIRLHPQDDIPEKWQQDVHAFFAHMEAVRKGRERREQKPKREAAGGEAEGASIPREAEGASIPREAEGASIPREAEGASIPNLRIKLDGSARIKQIQKPKHVDELIRVCKEAFNLAVDMPIRLQTMDGEDK